MLVWNDSQVHRSEPALNKPLILAGLGIAIVSAAIGLNYALWHEERQSGAPQATSDQAANSPDGTDGTTASAATATDATTDDTMPSSPSFDVVRINPRGDTVMAGRAAPGAKVTILDDIKPIGEVTADSRGEWVFVPEMPLAPGARRLTLRATQTDGSTQVSEKDVVLVVPEPNKDIAGQAATASQPLALEVSAADGQTTRILQKPSAEGDAPEMTVDAIDYDENGNLAISGRGHANALVLVYLNTSFIGRAEIDADGHWRLQPEAPVAEGLYVLRVDQVDATGKVVARSQIPFARSKPITDMRPGTFVVVQPGNSLWRLARQTYGSGVNYTVIYDANRDQIRNADLIYPGQVFALPSN